MTSTSNMAAGKQFPTAAGILLGLGLGGFFDGILLHQVFQWHHMLSSADYPPSNLENLQINTTWDGIFHVSTYIFTSLDLAILWRSARQGGHQWPARILMGTILLGHGIFNLVEGVIDHSILGIHHVNELVPQDQWVFWDMAFLLWGAIMAVGGWWLWKSSKEQAPGA